MRLKTELYAKEQDDTIDKIIQIIGITTEKNTITLYEIDNNEIIKQQLMELIPEIRTWNRDRNSASNIYKIASNAIHNMARPSYLCRETQCIMPLHRVGNTQNVHRSARTKP